MSSSFRQTLIESGPKHLVILEKEASGFLDCHEDRHEAGIWK